jgi:hypothetical protein
MPSYWELWDLRTLWLYFGNRRRDRFFSLINQMLKGPGPTLSVVSILLLQTKRRWSIKAKFAWNIVFNWMLEKPRTSQSLNMPNWNLKVAAPLLGFPDLRGNASWRLGYAGLSVGRCCCVRTDYDTNSKICNLQNFQEVTSINYLPAVNIFVRLIIYHAET